MVAESVLHDNFSPLYYKRKQYTIYILHKSDKMKTY